MRAGRIGLILSRIVSSGRLFNTWIDQKQWNSRSVQTQTKIELSPWVSRSVLFQGSSLQRYGERSPVMDSRLEFEQSPIDLANDSPRKDDTIGNSADKRPTWSATRRQTSDMIRDTTDKRSKVCVNTESQLRTHNSKTTNYVVCHYQKTNLTIDHIYLSIYARDPKFRPADPNYVESLNLSSVSCSGPGTESRLRCFRIGKR